MRDSQIAVQLYTVRDFCQTAGDLAAAARKIRAIGYHAIQLSEAVPVPDDEVVRIMAGEGLAICATHENSHKILAQPEACIDRLKRLGCRLAAYPYPRGVDFTSAASVKLLVRQLDAAGAKFHAAGLALGYHNHAIEFVRLEGAPALDYIYAHTGASNLVGEIGTYWIQYGGGDVVDWCRRLRGRLPFIHLKDYGFTAGNQPIHCEIGAGSLPFARIVAEAELSGCQWFIVEQDTCPGDPFESLRLSHAYITEHLIEAAR